MKCWPLSDRGLLQRAPPHGRLRRLREVSPSSPSQAATATPSQMCPSTPATPSTPPTPERQQPDPWGGSRPVCRWSEQKLVQSPQKVQCWPLCAGSPPWPWGQKRQQRGTSRLSKTKLKSAFSMFVLTFSHTLFGTLKILILEHTETLVMVKPVSSNPVVQSP